TLSNASVPATITTATATGLIQNDDSLTLAIAAVNATAAEGNSASTPFTFTIARGGDATSSLVVGYAVTGSGASPADAEDVLGGMLRSGLVQFAPGVTSAQVTINVNGDRVAEADEVFTVTLGNTSNPATITAASAAGLIRNDDSISLAIAATNATQAEGNSG